MPRFDGSGPMGQGPMGRGLGPCGAGRGAALVPGLVVASEGAAIFRAAGTDPAGVGEEAASARRSGGVALLHPKMRPRP